MSTALTTVKDLYQAMEQGNIGKLFSLLDHSFIIQGPLESTRKGREGILEILSTLYRQRKGIKKEIRHLIEHENLVIALGNIHIAEAAPAPVKIPFADVWEIRENKIVGLQYFYQDPLLLAKYLNQIM